MANQIIDIHSHFLTSEYLKFLEKQKALLEDGFPLPKYNNQEHLKLMKGCSIEWSLLSVSSPHPYFKDDIENSIKMCRHLNEQMAQLKKVISNILVFKPVYHYLMSKQLYKRLFTLWMFYMQMVLIFQVIVEVFI